MDVDVAIRTTDGTLQVLQMPPDCTVRHLTERIAMELGVPKEFQQLVDPSGACIHMCKQVSNLFNPYALVLGIMMLTV